MSSKSTILNFGRNVGFTPTEYHEPKNESEVLEILRGARGRSVRVVGSLHAWSRAAAGDQIVLSLAQLSRVELEMRNGEPFAVVGGGCQIKRLLKELQRQGEVTLPSLGLITEQTIAGACSTGTHGSGKHSLSHYLAEVRLAIIDENGNVRVETIDSGSELWAARCSLGCLGVILSVGIYCRPRYRIAEHWRWHDRLEDAVAMEEREPLQQFFLIPWNWRYLGQHRHESAAESSWLALLYRIYCFVVFDISLHVILVTLTRLLNARSAAKGFVRWIAPWCVIPNWRVVDQSESILVMQHELFRHVEIEMFVTRRQLAEAMPFVRAMIQHFDGASDAFDSSEFDWVRQSVSWDQLAEACASYTHCYPICIRRVMPDDALMSMSSDRKEDVYAVSFITYLAGKDRQGFDLFSRILCDLMIERFEARPHWGKICPISSEQVRQLYPRLEEYKEVAERFDPAHLFRNAWMNETVFDTQCDVTGCVVEGQ